MRIMRISYNSFSLILILLSLLLLVSSKLESSNDSVINKFLECLPNHAYAPISNAIFTPQNPSFLSVLHSYNRNLRYLSPQSPKPLAIITASHVTHAQAVVSCAKPLGLQIRIRSGGHDYAGLSYTSTFNDVPFVILDMFNLHSIDVYKADNNSNSMTVRVQAGATVGELYYRIAQESPIHAFPAGVCPTMGVGGHFSGGGYGNLMRKFGLSIDNIIDAEFIDANGVLHNRLTMGEDVFWAIRGGGAASFGVVVSWLIELVRVPKIVTVFAVDNGLSNVAHRWQLIAPNLPKDLFVRVMHVTKTSIRGNGVVDSVLKVSYIGLFLGNSEDLVSLMDKRFPELGLNKTDCIETSWINSTLFFYSPSQRLINSTLDILLERPKNGSSFAKGRSDFVKEPISKEGIESIWKKMIDLKDVTMQWNPYGGRMSKISDSATPFPHRLNLFKIQYPFSWMNANDTSTYLKKSKDFHDFMTPFVTSSPREAFFNYRDLDIGANPSNKTNFEMAKKYGSKYFKGNFDRLASVKTKIDPDNFFRNEQSIPTLSKQ